MPARAYHMSTQIKTDYIHKSLQEYLSYYTTPKLLLTARGKKNLRKIEVAHRAQ